MMHSLFSSGKVGVSTAENKELNICSNRASTSEWQHKRVDFWSPVDTVNWVMSVASANRLDCEEIHKFREVDGRTLLCMSERKLVILEPNCGEALYRSLEALKLKLPYDASDAKAMFMKKDLNENNIPHKELRGKKSQGTPDTSCTSTALYKQLDLPSFQVSPCDWQQKRVDKWTPADTVNWVISVARDSQSNCDEVHNFCHVGGERLVGMTEEEFVKFEPDCGRALYRAMQILCKQMHTKVKKIQCRPPRRKKKEKIGRLWEFIRDLLLNPQYCPSMVRWENYNEGVFRFVDSRKVAKLWGTIKDNPKMTYEKLSRAMRYYYRKKIFEAVLGQRLVYKFGPRAKGWQTANPNFAMKGSQSS